MSPGPKKASEQFKSITDIILKDVAPQKIKILKTIRLDLLVVEKGLFDSRETARTAIMDGAILVDGQKQTKPGLSVSTSAKVETIPSYSKLKFASRGGLKLEMALTQFHVPVAGRVCLDIGASTGGFTDCLLQNGAVKVYAIDVGYGQLVWSLRQDPRVVCIERFNARQLSPDTLYKNEVERNQWADLAVIDVSFISLEKVLSATFSTMNQSTAEAICLIKPQFEIGREKVGKGGVVRSKIDHIAVIEKVVAHAAHLNLFAHGIIHSPVKGPAGNIEFLVYLSKKECALPIDIESIVEKAHQELNKQSTDATIDLD